MNDELTQGFCVPAIVRQHIDDASYLWSHRSSNLWSPLFSRQHMVRLDHKLDANLEGLRIAGANGVEQSCKNLERWQTPEDAFVVLYILAHIDNAEAMAKLEAQLVEKPVLSNGAAAALLWAAPSIAQPVIDRWWFSEHDVLRLAAIPAAIVHPDIDMEAFIRQSAEDASPGVRLKAYRGIGEWRLHKFKDILALGVEESNIFCRAEAAASLALLGDSSKLHILPGVFHYFQHNRLRRYLLVWSALSSPEQFESWFIRYRGKKEQYRDALWALAFHGRGASLARLRSFIQHGYEVTLAAYVVSHITGVDLESEGLLLTPGNSDDDDRQDAKKPYDVGLLTPDSDGVIDWIDKHMSDYPADRCNIAGGEVSTLADQIFHAGTQPQRWQAALYLTLDDQAGALPSLLRPALSLTV